jgi:hypothetical protein
MGQIALMQPIVAPPRHVFAFFVPQRMPYWYGAEMESSLEVLGGASDFALGQKVRVAGTLAGRAVSHTAVVTAFASGQLFEWRFQDEHGVRGTERWELSAVPATPPDAAEQTIVRFTARYEMPGWFGRLLDRLVTQRAVVRRGAGDLRRLASLIEQRKQPAHAGSVVR